MIASNGLTLLRLARCCQMMAAIAMKKKAAPRAEAKASNAPRQTRPKTRATKKTKGGRGAKARKSRHSRLDSDAEKNSPIAADKSSTAKSPHIGTIYVGERIIATIQAKTKDDYERTKDVIEAGFRVRGEASSWGMNSDHYWQLHPFPSDHDDWKVRMERLASHSLHDDDASEMGRLMHACTWTLEPLWKWMHHLAEYAKNPNIQRDAGRCLGALYYEARQKKNRIKLGKANEEFERRVAPFGGIKKKPTPELVRWVNNRMRNHYELWKRAIEVAQMFEQTKHPKGMHFFSRDYVEDGVRHYELLPMTTMAEAWDGYFIQHRQRPGASWNEFLDELSAHPFCTNRLTLVQLTNFDQCWENALYDSLRVDWDTPDKLKQSKVWKGISFVHKFGDLKEPEGAGYWLAKDYFDYAFAPYWKHTQVVEARICELSKNRKPRTGTAVDPVTKRIVAAANQVKSRAG